MPPMSSLRIALTKLWTRDSSILLGGFFVTVILIIYIWWPLAEEYFAYVDWNGDWWRYMDWLLLGIFGVHVDHHHCPRRSQNGSVDHLRWHLRRTGDRIMGHADKSLALLHSRTPAAVDHPRLADCVAFH